MNFFADLIDLKTVEKQSFVLPKTLIFSIFNNSILNSRHKLLQCCKTFYLLHLKNGGSWINVLKIWKYEYEIDIGDGRLHHHKNHSRFGRNKFKMDIQVKTIKIMKFLMCCATEPSHFNILMPKFDITQLKEIYISVTFGLTTNLVKYLLPPSLEDLFVIAPSYDGGNLLLFALERCPNMIKTSISLHENVLFTTHLWTKHLIKRRFQVFVLASITDVNLEEFLNFVHAHMADKSFLRLTFAHGSAQIYENLKNFLFDIVKKQEKEENRNIQIFLPPPPEVHEESISVFL